VAFDGQGSLYVAEAGKFGPFIDTTNFGATHTGRVDKYSLSGGAPVRVWSTLFDSVYDQAHGQPEVLGPAGVSAFGNGCEKSDSHSEACHVLVIVSESRDGVNKTTSGLNIPQIGHLFRLDGANGTPTNRSDVGDQQYAWAGQHYTLWSEFPDANPYGVLVTKDPTTHADRTFVVDAGANTVSEVMPGGTNRVIAFIPNDGVRDSTPTCAAQGPDGALYIGTLNLFKNAFGFNPGQSTVYRVDPNTSQGFLTAATLWASGLTTVTACTFDRSGNFWGTEMFKGNANGPPGDLVRIPFSNPTTVQHVGGGSIPFPGGSIPFPGGIAQGPDGSMYVTVNSPIAAPNAGAVVKVAATA
jgi:hypothetical protein